MDGKKTLLSLKVIFFCALNHNNIEIHSNLNDNANKKTFRLIPFVLPKFLIEFWLRKPIKKNAATRKMHVCMFDIYCRLS